MKQKCRSSTCHTFLCPPVPPVASSRLAIPDSLTHAIASWAALDTRAIGVSRCSQSGSSAV